MSEVELLKFIGPLHDFQSLASLADSTLNEKGQQLTLGIDAQYWLYQAYQNVRQSSGPPRNKQILELLLAWVTVLHSMAIDAVFVFTGPFVLDCLDGLYEASIDAKVILLFQCAVIERGFEIHYSLKDTGVELGYLEVDGILRWMMILQKLQICPSLTIENAYPLSNTELGVLLCLAAEDLKQERLETYLLETWNPKLRQELLLNPHEFLPLQLPMSTGNSQGRSSFRYTLRKPKKLRALNFLGSRKSKENHQPVIKKRISIAIPSCANITIEDRVAAERICANNFYAQLRNCWRKTSCAEAGHNEWIRYAQDLEAQISGHESSTSPFVKNLQEELKEARLQLWRLGKELEKEKLELEKAKKRSERLLRTKDAIRKAVSRVPERLQRAAMVAVKNFTHQTMKKKNLVTPEMCLCIMDLVGEGASPEKVNNIIHSVGKSLGITVTDNISGRSARRVVGQAEIATQLQAVDLITCSNGVILSSDGTSHKGLNYESRHAHFRDPDTNEKMTLFLGISLAPGQSPAGQKQPLDKHQKKLFALIQELKKRTECEIRGERAIKMIAPDKVLYIALEHSAAAVEAAGGLSAWDALSDADHAVRSSEITKAVILQIGEDDFNKLTPGQQAEVDFCVWCGCDKVPTTRCHTSYPPPVPPLHLPKYHHAPPQVFLTYLPKRPSPRHAYKTLLTANPFKY
ncbi:hypothetical protein EV359DRAFT_67902 [Lentinula novae-zelandiae]|nr:hypothetical protein EV359DRAFT_67902 [Lentinula novae-zelandiae]